MDRTKDSGSLDEGSIPPQRIVIQNIPPTDCCRWAVFLVASDSLPRPTGAFFVQPAENMCKFRTIIDIFAQKRAEKWPKTGPNGVCGKKR